MTESLETSEAEAVQLSAEQMAQNLAAVEAFAAQASIGHLGRLTLSTTYAEHEIRGECGELIAASMPHRQQEARRLVACWNACDGLETYALELMTGDLSIEKQIKPAFKPTKAETSLAVQRRHEIDSLHAVNAELLEALEELSEIVQCAIDNKSATDLDSFTLQPARAAIASARKQGGQG